MFVAIKSARTQGLKNKIKIKKMRAKVAEEGATQCRTRILQKCVQDELLSHAASLHGVPSALLSSPGPLMHLPNHGVCKVLLLKAEASRYVYTNGRFAESQSRKTGHLQIRVPMPEMPDQMKARPDRSEEYRECQCQNVYTPAQQPDRDRDAARPQSVCTRSQ